MMQARLPGAAVALILVLALGCSHKKVEVPDNPVPPPKNPPKSTGMHVQRGGDKK